MSKTSNSDQSDEALTHLDAAWAYYSPPPPQPVRHVRREAAYWRDPAAASGA